MNIISKNISVIYLREIYILDGKAERIRDDQSAGRPSPVKLISGDAVTGGGIRIDGLGECR